MTEAKQITPVKFDYDALDMETRIVVQSRTERIRERTDVHRFLNPEPKPAIAKFEMPSSVGRDIRR